MIERESESTHKQDLKTTLVVILMTSLFPPKQPCHDAQGVPVTTVNAMLGERNHPVQKSDKTSNILAYDTIFNNDTDGLTFVRPLHALLEAAANEGFDHIVSWLDNNASFKVHQPALFVKLIMPRFFKRQSRYKSFQRQLNLWQFQRLIGSKGRCNGGYFHVFFHRHGTSLFHLMKRSKLSPPSFWLKEGSSHDNFESDPFDDVEIPKVKHSHSSKCLTTSREPESLGIYSSCMFESEQNINANTPLLDGDIMTPYGAHSSVPCSDELSIHRDFVNLDTSQTQDPNIVARELQPLTSTSGLLPNSWEIELPKDYFNSCNLNDQQVLTPRETMPDLCLSSPLGDCFDEDELLPQCTIDKGSTEGRPPPILSAEEWKYVLVGMQIAMNAR